MPIQCPSQGLVRTGDHVLKIEGIFSGTLSYIFNSFDGSKPFSEVVSQVTHPPNASTYTTLHIASNYYLCAHTLTSTG